MGCDLTYKIAYLIQSGFNPRTHMGCDKLHPISILGVWGFNPRTHMGCDRFHLDEYIINLDVSIHAPTWGATGHIPFDES